MDYVHMLDNPLAGNALRILRDRNTEIKEFRRAMNNLGLLLASEAGKKLTYKMEQVNTPLDVTAECVYIDDKKLLLVPILRAGMGLVESFLTFFPEAQVAHIGMYRDHETLEARPYVNTTPQCTSDVDKVLVLDPMLATGNSGVKALEFVINKGYDPKQVLFICALSTEQGIGQIHSRYPEIEIITAAIDPYLNEKAYIVPGLGDAGDRLYLR